MELRNIRTFQRVAELSSFTRAAEDMGYSQSAVTMQIKQLEEELGCMLFERIGKRPTLTQEGKIFIEYTAQILDNVSSAEAAIKEERDISGTLRIGSGGSLISNILPEVMKKFREQYPKVMLNISTAKGTSLFDPLNKNDVDLLLFVDKPRYADEWVNAVSVPTKILFVTSQDHALAKKRKVSLADVLESDFAVTEHGISYSLLLEEAAAANGIPFRPAVEADDTGLLKTLAKSASVIAFLPEYSVRKELEAKELKIIAPSDFDMTLYCQILYHKSKVVTPQMHIFIDLLKDHLSSSRVPIQK